jgi:hypothetical protein
VFFRFGARRMEATSAFVRTDVDDRHDVCRSSGLQNALVPQPFADTFDSIDLKRSNVLEAVTTRLNLSQKQAAEAYALAETHEANPRSVWGEPPRVYRRAVNVSSTPSVLRSLLRCATVEERPAGARRPSHRHRCGDRDADERHPVNLATIVISASIDGSTTS